MAIETEEPSPEAPAAEKASPREVNYRQADGDQLCQGCAFFEMPSSCSMVQGMIDPSWTCDLWQPRRGPTPSGGEDIMGQLFG